jgi:hypothetical protein
MEAQTLQGKELSLELPAGAVVILRLPKTAIDPLLTAAMAGSRHSDRGSSERAMVVNVFGRPAVECHSRLNRAPARRRGFDHQASIEKTRMR